MDTSLIIVIIACAILAAYLIYLKLVNPDQLAKIALEIVTYAELLYDNNTEKKEYAMQQIKAHLPEVLKVFFNEEQITKYLDAIVEAAVEVLKSSLTEDSEVTIKKLIKALKNVKA